MQRVVNSGVERNISIFESRNLSYVARRIACFDSLEENGGNV